MPFEDDILPTTYYLIQHLEKRIFNVDDNPKFKDTKFQRTWQFEMGKHVISMYLVIQNGETRNFNLHVKFWLNLKSKLRINNALQTKYHTRMT